MLIDSQCQSEVNASLDEFSYLDTVIVTHGRCNRGASDLENVYHKHNNELDLYPQFGGLRRNALTTAPSERLLWGQYQYFELIRTRLV